MPLEWFSALLLLFAQVCLRSSCAVTSPSHLVESWAEQPDVDRHLHLVQRDFFQVLAESYRSILAGSLRSRMGLNQPMHS